MYFELFVAAALLCLGGIVFGRFAGEVPRLHRIAKAVVFIGVTALASHFGGRAAALAWIGGVLVLGMAVHGWWTRRNGIGFWTPEPWDRYRALRRWNG
jgi:hypothetical protein